MGIDLNSAKFLVSSFREGMSFLKTITIGRQDLLLSEDETISILGEYGFPFMRRSSKTVEFTFNYADEFLKHLGAREIVSMDVSDYEGATIIHDMNVPIPDNLKEQFDLVFDGGTLEHVFNFPTGLKNCLEMVKLGGRFVSHTPSNNYCGHGFYQFGPELFFRTLSKGNGFDLERIVAVDMVDGCWYNITDPVAIGKRVELINFHPTQLFVQAKRISRVGILDTSPQQSDYVVAWDNKTWQKQKREFVLSGIRKWRQLLVSFLGKRLTIVLDLIRLLGSRRISFRNKKMFKRC